jgi:phenylalanyl-tRNA synthetase beta chain
MKWLSDFVSVETPVKQYAADLSMSGSKVEGYETEGESLKNIVAGKVLDVQKHPNADTLYICQIEAGADSRCKS